MAITKIRKTLKYIQIVKEDIKLFLFVGDIILDIEHPKEHTNTKKLSELIIGFNNVAR